MQRISKPGSFRFVLTLSMMFGTASSVLGASVVKVLHPPGADRSLANAIAGSGVGGSVVFGERQQAAIWNGKSSSWTNLAPQHSDLSAVLGLDSFQQVGYVRTTTPLRAALWTGTQESFVDLQPNTASRSAALSVHEGHQVGWAEIDGIERATLWRGTADSLVDLNPQGSTRSRAYAVFKGPQAGLARIGGVYRAGRWQGSADTWVSVAPEGATYSCINQISENQQVGDVLFEGGHSTAALWTGTSASWINLDPVGSTYSSAFGVAEGIQVGYSSIGGQTRASLWRGSSETWTDLDALLPAEYSGSVATSVTVIGDQILIGGYAFPIYSNQSEAVVWTIPSPSGLAVAGACSVWMMRRRRGRAGVHPDSAGAEPAQADLA